MSGNLLNVVYEGAVYSQTPGQALLRTSYIAFVMPVVLVLLNFLGILRGRTMLKAWRWVIFLCFAFTAVMVPTPEPITLIGMSAAISSLFFAAVGISIWNDRRRDRREGTDALDDDEASEIDAPSRLDEPDGA